MYKKIFIVIFVLLSFQCVVKTSLAAEITQGELEKIETLSVQLQDYRTRRNAYKQLEVLATLHKEARIPLIKLFMHKQANKGGMYETVRFANSFFLKIYKIEKADSATIRIMVDVLKKCAPQNNRWYEALANILLIASKGSVLTEEEIFKLYEIADLYMQPVRVRQTTAYKAKNVMMVIAAQGKYRTLSAEIISIAKELLGAYNKGIQKVGVDVIASQLTFANEQSKEALFQVINSDKPSYVRHHAFLAIVESLSRSRSPEADVNRLVDSVKKSKNSDASLYFKRSLAMLRNHPVLSSRTKAKLYELTQGKGAGKDYLALKKYQDRFEKSSLSDSDIRELIKKVAKYRHDKIGQEAEAILMKQSQTYGFSQAIHDELILAVMNNDALFFNTQFKDLAKSSIPYTYLKSANKPDYPDNVLLDVLDVINNNKKAKVRVFGLDLLNEIKKHQEYSRKFIDKMYSLYLENEETWLRARILKDYLVGYYKKTGYLNLALIEKEITKQNNSYSYFLYDMYLSHIGKSNKNESKEAFKEIYRNNNLSERLRLKAVSKLIELDFDFAQKIALTPQGFDTGDFMHTVLSIFNSANINRGKIVEKEILFDLTKHTNAHVRRLAWKMLKSYQVSTPIRVRLNDEYMRKVLYFEVLFFTNIAALFLGFFLYMGGIKGYASNPPVILKVAVWLLATSIYIGLHFVMFFVTGLSHSGYPYNIANEFMLIALAVYIVLGIVVRILTNMTKSKFPELKGSE